MMQNPQDDPAAPTAEDRYTLDRLMTDISDQAGIPITSFMPCPTALPTILPDSMFITMTV